MFSSCPPATPTRATPSPANGFFTNHESRNTNHGLYAFVAAFLRAVARHRAAMARHGRRPSPAPAARPVGFSPATNHATCFPPVLRRLQREQPQARPTGFSRITNHETRITAFMLLSLLSCAPWRGIGRLWRGMGGRRPPRRQHGLLGFHQPRITQHVFPLPSGDSKESNPKPGQRVFHESRNRDTNHGLYATLLFHGAAWAAAVPRAGNTADWVFTSHESRNMFFPCPPATPRRATPSTANGFFTNHETRNTNHGLYAFVAAFLRAVARHRAAMARHGRPPSPAPATRPVGFSPATNHATCFSPALRRLQGEQPQARPTGFSRITKHETRITAFMPFFPQFPTISRHFPAPPHPRAGVRAPSAVFPFLPGERRQPPRTQCRPQERARRSPCPSYGSPASIMTGANEHGGCPAHRTLITI